VFCFFFSVEVFAQPSKIAVKPGIEEIYLAKDDGEGKAGEVAAHFLTTDVPIHCVVLFDSAEPVTVKMNLVAVSVLRVPAESKVVSTSYTTKQDQNRVNFSGQPDGSWIAGKYRADIFINNTFAGKLNFEIRRPSSTVKAVLNLRSKQPSQPKVVQRKRNR